MNSSQVAPAAPAALTDACVHPKVLSATSLFRGMKVIPINAPGLLTPSRSGAIFAKQQLGS